MSQNAKTKFNLKNPRLRTVLFALLLAVGGSVLWYQNFFISRINEQVVLKREREQKENELNAIKAMKPQLARLQAEMKVNGAKLDSLKAVFPDQKEIPKLIGEITKVATASGIYITRFSPLPDVVKEYYVENRYSLQVSGGYHQIASFFAFFANLPLIINLTNVNMAVNSGIAESVQENIDHGAPVVSVQAGFEMTTFSSKK